MTRASCIGYRQTIKNEDKIDFEDLDLLMVIGRGAFGKVYLAKVKNDKKNAGRLLAVKSLRKDVLIE